MTQRRGQELPAGLEAVHAIINGLTMEHSSELSRATSPASSGSIATATGEISFFSPSSRASRAGGFSSHFFAA
jgi:hypothetical protein